MEKNMESQKDGVKQVQGAENGKAAPNETIPTPRRRFRYRTYLRIMAVWKYLRRAAAVMMALVLTWGIFTQPPVTHKFWPDHVAAYGCFFAPFALLGLGRKATSIYYVATFGISYSLFLIYPPLLEFTSEVFEALKIVNEYLP